MKDQGHWGLLLLITLSALGAGAAVTADTFARPETSANSHEFQQLVGGLGFGPALNLETCPFCFDPRLGFVCQQQIGSLPGSHDFCSRHACSVLSIRPLGVSGADTAAEAAEEERDAEVY